MPGIIGRLATRNPGAVERPPSRSSLRKSTARNLTHADDWEVHPAHAHCRFVAHAATSARLPLFAQRSHATVEAARGVKQPRSGPPHYHRPQTRLRAPTRISPEASRTPRGRVKAGFAIRTGSRAIRQFRNRPRSRRRSARAVAPESPALARKEEPALARFQLTPTAAPDESEKLDGLLLGQQISHQRAAQLTAGLGVEQPRSAGTMRPTPDLFS